MEAIVEYLKAYNYASDKRRANIIDSEKTLLNDFLGGDRIRHDPLKEFEEGEAFDANAHDLDSILVMEDSEIVGNSKASVSPALSMERTEAEGFDDAIEFPSQRSDAIEIVDSPGTPASATRLLPNATQSDIQNRSSPSAFPHSYSTTGITRESIRNIFGGPSPLNFSPCFGAACSQTQDTQPSLALNQVAGQSASLSVDATESVPFGGHPDLTSTTVANRNLSVPWKALRQSSLSDESMLRQRIHRSNAPSWDPHSHPMFDEALRGHRRYQSNSQLSNSDSISNANHPPLRSEYLHGGENSDSPQVQKVPYKHQSSNHSVHEPQEDETQNFDRQSFHDNHLFGISQKHGTYNPNQQSSPYNNPLNNLYQNTASSTDDQILRGRMEEERMQLYGTEDLRFGSLYEARMDNINTDDVHNSIIDETFPRTDEDDCHCVAKLLVSMYEMSQAKDNETMLKTWRGSMNDRERVEEAAWDILACCKSRHQRNGPFPLSKKPQSEYSTFEQRLSSICRAMLYQKTVCQSLVKQSFREEVIENPICAVARIRNNRKVNLVKKHAIEVGREAMGVRTAGKGYKVTSVSNSDSDDEQYEMEEQSPMNLYPPATFPVQGFKRRITDFQDGESAHYYREGSIPKKAKRSKHRVNKKKGVVDNNNNRSHTKMKGATNLGGEWRQEHDLAFVHNIAAANKTDSAFQATRNNGIRPNGPQINQANGSNKRRRATDEEADYHQDGEYHHQAHGSRKAKIRKTK